jgi:hypothetical protein
MDERRTPPEVPCGHPEPAASVRQGLRQRTLGERLAFIDGFRSAVRLVESSGLKHAEASLGLLEKTFDRDSGRH